MKTYVCDYACASPELVLDCIDYAFPGTPTRWRDVDEDCFIVSVFGVMDLYELDDILAEFLFERG